MRLFFALHSKRLNMKLLLAILATFLSFSTHAASNSSWHAYTDPNCNYTLQYPNGSKISTTTESGMTHQYRVDPIQYIHDLQNIKQLPTPPKEAFPFATIKIQKTCAIKVTLPIKEKRTNLDGRYLFVFVLDNIPKQWPIPQIYFPGREQIFTRINNNEYFVVATSNADMCHNIDNTYFFLKKDNKYYVLNFALTSHCFGIADSDKKTFNEALESSDFRKIISSFKVNTTEVANAKTKPR